MSVLPSSNHLFSALRDTVSDMQTRGRITRIAGVKPELCRRLPEFDERRAGFRSFAAFIDSAESHGFVRLVTDDDGWRRVVAGGSQPGQGDLSDRLRPDIWRAFTEWGEGWSRCWDRATARAVQLSIAPRLGEPDEHKALRAALFESSETVIRIDPVSMSEQKRWMHEFATGLGDHPLSRPLAAALEDERPFRAFSAVLNADPVLRRDFHRVKRSNVLEAVRQWAARNKVDLDALDHSRPSDALEPTFGTRVSGTTDDTARQIRAALHRAIEDMPVEDLRRLAVPIGYVVDAWR